jgi:hypothetical protein
MLLAGHVGPLFLFYTLVLVFDLFVENARYDTKGNNTSILADDDHLLFCVSLVMVLTTIIIPLVLIPGSAIVYLNLIRHVMATSQC